MASYTEHLNLLKKDPVADGADTFNVDTMLNENWDKIDAAVAKRAELGEDGKVKEEQLPDMDYEGLLKDNALKETPVDADSLPLVDSADGSKTKRLLWSRAKAVLKAYFDPLYAAAAHSHAWGAITGKPDTFPPSTHNHAAGDINSGILGVARGGTGKGSFDANRLLYASAADVLAQLGFPATAGSVLRQGTSGAPYWTSPDELLAALGLTGAAKIATGSYVGTGTYGASNPCSLTFKKASLSSESIIGSDAAIPERYRGSVFSVEYLTI